VVGPIPARRVPNRNLLKVTEEEKLAEKRKKKAAYNRSYREANKSKRAAYMSAYYAANKDKWVAHYETNKVELAAKQRLRRFGISQEQYDRFLTAQNSSCAICHSTEPGGTGFSFHIDHCHSSGKVRGLLCHHCNVGLGHFRDDPAALSRAIAYLATQGNIDGAPQAP
jgi:recombination endonuclease VII